MNILTISKRMPGAVRGLVLLISLDANTRPDPDPQSRNVLRWLRERHGLTGFEPQEEPVIWLFLRPACRQRLDQRNWGPWPPARMRRGRQLRFAGSTLGFHQADGCVDPPGFGAR